MDEKSNDDTVVSLIHMTSASSETEQDLGEDGLVQTASVSDVKEDLEEDGLVQTSSASVVKEDLEEGGLVQTASVSDVKEDLAEGGLVQTISISDDEEEDLEENGLVQTASASFVKEDLEEGGLVQTASVSDVKKDLEEGGLVQTISISDDEEEDLEEDGLVQTASASSVQEDLADGGLVQTASVSDVEEEDLEEDGLVKTASASHVKEQDLEEDGLVQTVSPRDGGEEHLAEDGLMQTASACQNVEENLEKDGPVQNASASIDREEDLKVEGPMQKASASIDQEEDLKVDGPVQSASAGSDAKKDLKVDGPVQSASASGDAKKDLKVNGPVQKASASIDQEEDLKVDGPVQSASASSDAKKDLKVDGPVQSASASGDAKKDLKVNGPVQKASTSIDQEEDLKVEGPMHTVSASGDQKQDMKVDGVVQKASGSDDGGEDMSVDVLVQTVSPSDNTENQLKMDGGTGQESKGNGIPTHIQKTEDGDNQVVIKTRPDLSRHPCSLSTFSRSSVKAKGVRLSTGKKALNIKVLFNLANSTDLIHLKPFIHRSIKCHTEEIDGVICVTLVYSPSNYKKAVLKLKKLKINGNKLSQFRIHNLPRIRGLNVIVFFNLAKFADLVHLKPFIQRSTKYHTEEIDGITFVSLVYSTYHYKDDVLKLRNLEINGKKLSQFRTHNLPPIKRTCVRANNLPATVETELLSTVFPKAEDIVIRKDEKCCAILTFPDLARAEKCLIEHKGLKIKDNQLTMDIIDHNHDEELKRTRVRVNNLPANVETDLLIILFPNAEEIEKDAKCCVMLTFPDLPDAEECLVERTHLRIKNNLLTMDIIDSNHGKVLMTNGPVQEGKEPKHQQVYEALLQHVTQGLSCESEEITPQAKRRRWDDPGNDQPDRQKGTKDSSGSKSESLAVTSGNKERQDTDTYTMAMSSDCIVRLTEDETRRIEEQYLCTLKFPDLHTEWSKMKTVIITGDKMLMGAAMMSIATTTGGGCTYLYLPVPNKVRQRIVDSISRINLEIPDLRLLMSPSGRSSTLKFKCYSDRITSLRDRVKEYILLVVKKKHKGSLLDFIKGNDSPQFQQSSSLQSHVSSLPLLMSMRPPQQQPMQMAPPLNMTPRPQRPLNVPHLNMPLPFQQLMHMLPPLQRPLNMLPPLQRPMNIPPHPQRPLNMPPPHQRPLNMPPPHQWPMNMPPAPQQHMYMPPSPQQLMHMAPPPQQHMNMPPGPRPPAHMAPLHPLPMPMPPFNQPRAHLPPFNQPQVNLPPFNQPQVHLPPVSQPQVPMPPPQQPPAHQPPIDQPPVRVSRFDQLPTQVPEPPQQLQQSQARGSSSSQMSVHDEQMQQKITAAILAKLAPQADVHAGSNYDKMQALIKEEVNTRMTEMKKQQQPGSSPNLPASSSTIHNDNRDTRSGNEREGFRDGQEDRAGLAHQASEWAQKTSRSDEHSSIQEDDLREYLQKKKRHQSQEHHSMHEKELREKETWKKRSFDDHEREGRQEREGRSESRRDEERSHAMQEKDFVKQAEIKREERRLKDEREKVMDERRLLKRKYQEEEEEHQQRLLNEKQKLMKERKLIEEAKQNLELQQQELDKKRLDDGQRILAEHKALRRQTSLTETAYQAPSDSASDVYGEMPSKQRDQSSYSAEMQREDQRLKDERDKLMDERRLLKRKYQEEEEEHQQRLLNQKQKLVKERKLIEEAKRNLEHQQQELDKKRLVDGQRFLAERNALRRQTSLTESAYQAPADPYRASLTSDPYSASEVYGEMSSKQRDQSSYSGHYYNSSPNLQAAPPRSMISAIHQPAMAIQDNMVYSGRLSNTSVAHPVPNTQGMFGVQTVSQSPSRVSSLQATHNISPINPNYGQIPGKGPGMSSRLGHAMGAGQPSGIRSDPMGEAKITGTSGINVQTATTLELVSLLARAREIRAQQLMASNQHTK